MSEGLPGSFAVDGNGNTHSCTQDDRPSPWWFVDLGQEYSINSVTITFPIVGGDECNYHTSGFV